MELCRLVYVSDVTRPMTDAEVTALVEHCRATNEARGISGLLLFSGSHFLQVLEGDPMRVPSLYAQISRDPRHCNAQQLVCRAADKRLFPHWGMQLVKPTRSAALDREAIDKTILRLRLKQNDENGSEAISLLQEFRRQLQSQAA